MVFDGHNHGGRKLSGNDLSLQESAWQHHHVKELATT